MAWHVTTQVPTSKLVNGQATDGVDVSFATDAGLTGTVFVSHAQYAHVEQVKAVVAARVAQMEAVAGLTSET